MAVPRTMDEEETPEGIYGEEGIGIGIALAETETETENETPPHLRSLAEAAQFGNLDALRHSLDNLSGSIDEPVEDGDTVLHLTCLYGHLACVQLLLERGANLETKDEDGAIPLHDACAGGFAEIVQLLITAGSSSECLMRMLDTVDVEGDTPLHHAARGEHVDVVRILLAAGASPTRANIFGRVPAELCDPGTDVRRVLEAAAANAICG